ncbi:cyclin-D3-1 [Senna tora]|uniref:B-like cyclin n=1 Tax=Senna tora TaxID=362788 RepID=A0A834SWR8_9FABA|nr:cyclin-D3-1 [Senna tora]
MKKIQISLMDLFCEEDEELNSLFSKEQKEKEAFSFHLDSCLLMARREAVEWMLRVNTHYGFSALTSILAINYLDRFLFSFKFQREKPWMIQLVAVTCLSLAAKVEETHVPLLLDLQVEDSKYVFEAKTIQRMELLVLSTLKWKMHPVTPLSFLDHIIRRLGLKSHLHWEFLKRCENLLLSTLSDSRLVGWLPSVLATAIMLHVIEQMEHNDHGTEYKKQLLSLLKISKEKVEECYEGIVEVCSKKEGYDKKRKYEKIPESPNAVFGSESDASNSNHHSWTALGSSSSSSSLCSSSPQPLFKKTKLHHQQQCMNLLPLNMVAVTIVASSP